MERTTERLNQMNAARRERKRRTTPTTPITLERKAAAKAIVSWLVGLDPVKRRLTDRATIVTRKPTPRRTKSTLITRGSQRELSARCARRRALCRALPAAEVLGRLV